MSNEVSLSPMKSSGKARFLDFYPELEKAETKEQMKSSGMQVMMQFGRILLSFPLVAPLWFLLQDYKQSWGILAGMLFTIVVGGITTSAALVWYVFLVASEETNDLSVLYDVVFAVVSMALAAIATASFYCTSSDAQDADDAAVSERVCRQLSNARASQANRLPRKEIC